MPIPAPVDAIVLREFVFERAAFASCHAATIAEDSGGRLVAAWFGGSHESASDVKIYLSRREGDRWTDPRVVADGVDHGVAFACYNPVLVAGPGRRMTLFYKFGAGPQTWRGRRVTSEDDGATWGHPIDLPPGVLGPIKNKPLILDDGTWLCGSSVEDGRWRVRFESTRDGGATWRSTDFVNDGRAIGAIQPSILPLGGHRLRAIGRTRQGNLFAVDSPDDGKSWDAMRLIEVPNPNSGIDAVRLRDGRFLLVYNATAKGRSPLDVAISRDAERWDHAFALEDRPGAEFSYPAVIQTRDGRVHVLYTWERRRIAHVVIDPARLDPARLGR